MTEPQVTYSDEARAELAALANYIADQDGKKRAEMILGRIHGTIRTLAFMPGMGQARPYLREGMRAFVVAPWTIVYVPLPELDGIRVIRVVDGRRGLPEILK